MRCADCGVARWSDVRWGSHDPVVFPGLTVSDLEDLAKRIARAAAEDRMLERFIERETMERAEARKYGLE